MNDTQIKEMAGKLRAEGHAFLKAADALDGIQHEHRGTRHVVAINTTPKRTRRPLSAAGRARIVAAQRARWAKLRGAKKKAA